MPAKQGIFPSGDQSAGKYPFSPAVVVGEHVFVAGQGPINPATGKIEGESIEQQVELTLNNIKRILEAAGCTMDDCVKLTTYLSDIANFDRYNAVYRTFFNDPRPARTTVECKLWGGILVEIDAIAVKGCGRKG